MVAEKYSFFHWDLELPDIFYDENGKRKENPGFDAVVGNPPYGAKLTETERQYYKIQYSKVGGTDTAQLMIFLALKVLSIFGTNGFIVPKALVFASNWRQIREILLGNLSMLIDCKKVWKEVKLEQIVYVWHGNKNNSSYISGSRKNNILSQDTTISKKMCIEYDFLLCDINQCEITLGQKIHKKSEMLGKYINNNRGSMLQNKIKKHGTKKVLGGSQIQRYYIDSNIKGYINVKDIDDNKAYIKPNSILVQNIVSHIENPVEHIKITASIGQTDFIIIDTINQITVKDVDPYYVLGLLNSKIINWYAHRFIFAKAIRTMHFDNFVTNKIPILIKNETEISNTALKLSKYMKTLINKPLPTYCNELICELNHMFYEVFSLTDEEINMIEAHTPE